MPPTIALDDRVVPVRSARQNLRLFETAGVAASALLAGTGLAPADLDDDTARISCRQAVDLLRNGLRLCGRPGLGLESARGFSLSSYGFLGYAMMSCADLAHAMRIARTYYRTAGALFELEFTDDGADAFVVRVRDVLGLGDVWPFVVEQFFAGIPPLLELLLGHPVPARRLRLTYPAPPWEERYRETFGCPLVWSADACEYQLDRTLLQAPLARADAGVARLFEASCRELLEEIENEQNLAGTITRSLLSHTGAPPPADAMARRLNMGTRTLRRRLAELGTSYQKILDEVRRRLALDYLRSTQLSTQEVAELLGFTEATNFRRAFIKWTGESPRQYRRRARAGERPGSVAPALPGSTGIRDLHGSAPRTGREDGA